MQILDILPVWIRFTVTDFSVTLEQTTYSLVTHNLGSLLFTAILSVNNLYKTLQFTTVFYF